MDQKPLIQINNRLERIAKLLFLNANYIGNNGLLNGKTGIAIFFYLYSVYSRKRIYRRYADELIREVFTGKGKAASLDYENGLTGIGAGLVYLLSNKLIDKSGYNILPGIDRQVKNAISNFPNEKKKNNELLGYGNYLNFRLKSLTAENTSERLALRELLFTIVDLLDKPYYTYPEIFDAIEFLSSVSRISGSFQKPRDYLNYAIDKLETNVYEDVHFNVYPGLFNPLTAAKVILSAAESTQEPSYLPKASYFMETYGKDFDKYFTDNRHSLKAGTLKWTLLYDQLFRKLKNADYSMKAQKLFEKSMIENKDTLTGFNVGTCETIPELGIWDGYAGIGLALISVADKRFSGWQYLLPN